MQSARGLVIISAFRTRSAGRWWRKGLSVAGVMSIVVGAAGTAKVVAIETSSAEPVAQVWHYSVPSFSRGEGLSLRVLGSTLEGATGQPLGFVGPVGNSLSRLAHEAAFTPFVPGWLPRQWSLRRIEAPVGWVKDGKIRSFSLLYDSADGRAALELSEFYETTFIPLGRARKVELPDGRAAMLSSWSAPSSGHELWFEVAGVKIAFDEGIVAYGIRVANLLRPSTLEDVAGSVKQVTRVAGRG